MLGNHGREGQRLLHPDSHRRRELYIDSQLRWQLEFRCRQRLDWIHRDWPDPYQHTDLHSKADAQAYQHRDADTNANPEPYTDANPESYADANPEPYTDPDREPYTNADRDQHTQANSNPDPVRQFRCSGGG
jgi:hypothetical protein